MYSNFTFFKEDLNNGYQIRQKESRDILGYKGSYQKEYYIGNIKTKTKTGVQVRYDVVNNIELTRTKNRTTNTNELMLGNVRELNGGAYISQKFSLLKKLDITGSIRSDYFTNRYDDKLASKSLSSN